MAASRRVVAREHAALEARVIATRALHYTSGSFPSEDRPAHVRAGSALGWMGGRIAVIQDDANFVAFVDAESGEVDALALSAGEGGNRCFDDARGNKAHKLDLEACIVHGSRLIAFGSGSTARRERLVVVDRLERRAELIDVGALYAALRARADFAGSELNIEGAALLDGDRVVLLQRGNGAPRGELLPIDATVELSLDALVGFVDRGGRGTPPALGTVTQFDLGAIDGVRLTFTDAAARGNDLVFLAAAEASPDAVRDGPVAGVALGVVDGAGTARWTRVRAMDGSWFAAKAEGLLFDRVRADRAFAVVDADDPERATELVVLELRGF
jgi:hypothetical protein